MAGRLLLLASILFFSLSAVSSQERRTTQIKVIAYEYYDEYQLPDCKTWQKVESIKIEGESHTGGTQVLAAGPGEELEAVLYNVSIPSDYWVTVVWQGGATYQQSFTSNPRAEIVHQIYQPF